MFNLDYFLYMAEIEGLDNLVDTREACINAAINDFIEAARTGYNINTLVEDILANHDLDINDLSQKELDYIKYKVEKRF